MFDTLFRIVPLETAGPALLAGLAWVGLNHAAAPEIGSRLAHNDLLPACERDLADAVAITQNQHAEQASRIQAERQRLIAEAQATAAANAAKVGGTILLFETMVTDGPVSDLIEMVDPDGDYLEIVEMLVPEVPEVDLDKLFLPTLPASPDIPGVEEQSGACSCAISRVLADRRWELALYTASLTLHRADDFRAFPAAVLAEAQSRACDQQLQ